MDDIEVRGEPLPDEDQGKDPEDQPSAQDDTKVPSGDTPEEPPETDPAAETQGGIEP